MKLQLQLILISLVLNNFGYSQKLEIFNTSIEISAQRKSTDGIETNEIGTDDRYRYSLGLTEVFVTGKQTFFLNKFDKTTFELISSEEIVMETEDYSLNEANVRDIFILGGQIFQVFLNVDRKTEALTLFIVEYSTSTLLPVKVERVVEFDGGIENCRISTVVNQAYQDGFAVVLHSKLSTTKMAVDIQYLDLDLDLEKSQSFNIELEKSFSNYEFSSYYYNGKSLSFIAGGIGNKINGILFLADRTSSYLRQVHLVNGINNGKMNGYRGKLISNDELLVVGIYQEDYSNRHEGTGIEVQYYNINNDSLIRTYSKVVPFEIIKKYWQENKALPGYEQHKNGEDNDDFESELIDVLPSEDGGFTVVTNRIGEKTGASSTLWAFSEIQIFEFNSVGEIVKGGIVPRYVSGDYSGVGGVLYHEGSLNLYFMYIENRTLKFAKYNKTNGTIGIENVAKYSEIGSGLKFAYLSKYIRTGEYVYEFYFNNFLNTRTKFIEVVFPD